MARCRLIGYPELTITLTLVLAVACAPAVFTDDRYSGRDRVLLALLIAACVVIRIGIAIEWAEATAEGLAWTTVFVVRRYSWDQVRFIEDTHIWMGRDTVPGISVGVTRLGPPRLVVHQRLPDGTSS